VNKPCRGSGATLTAGVDEAGRGPLAGPVVVAALILPAEHELPGLNDSKKLSAGQREALYEPILAASLAWHIEVVGLEEIERFNILGATLRGMQRCIEALDPQPALALIDGNRLPASLPCPARGLVGGDGLEPCISGASILAKVYRDRLMAELHDRYPDYGFDRHKGYPTALHLERLAQHGPCAEHRRSFGPVRKILELWEND
jgi:ribonuclease HII